MKKAFRLPEKVFTLGRYFSVLLMNLAVLGCLKSMSNRLLLVFYSISSTTHRKG
ncbi:MAG: hypothetical protein IKH45_03925 [Neisseriaceae bacterium]|nr:hypothetical protein [Neisseriaceae bacterium]